MPRAHGKTLAVTVVMPTGTFERLTSRDGKKGNNDFFMRVPQTDCIGSGSTWSA